MPDGWRASDHMANLGAVIQKMQPARCVGMLRYTAIAATKTKVDLERLGTTRY